MAQVTRSKVVDQNGTAQQEPSETAPQLQVPVADTKPTPQKMMARVKLVVGRSNYSHGKQFIYDKWQTIVDEDLIEEFKNDGNFLVEMVDTSNVTKRK